MNAARFAPLVLGLLFLLLLPATLRAGDEPPAQGARAAEIEAVTTLLGALEARMKALVLRAELLREAGRAEEALAVLDRLPELETELASLKGRLEALGSQDPPSWRIEPPKPGPLVARPPSPDADLGAARRARLEALEWLVAHQGPDGSWSADGFDRFCYGEPDRGSRLQGAGKPLYSPGVTGLAVLAFLEAGVHPGGSDKHAAVVERGLHHLRSIQDPEGCFGPRSTQHYVYNHAIAALALVDAYGRSGQQALLASAQRGLDFIALARNPYFAWRYGVKPGDNDTSITGWMVHVLHRARVVNAQATSQGKRAPLVIDESAFDGALAWIDKMTDAETGRVGYIQRGSSPARPQEMLDRFPPDKSEAMTAVGVGVRLLLGADPKGDVLVRKGARLLKARPPVWNTGDGSIDMIYWFHGTHALHLFGGQAWLEWRDALLRALIPSQRQDGEPCGYHGSWDPADPWGPDGGRVYATALMALTLGVLERPVSER